MFELRDYQKEAVDAAVKYLKGRSKKPGVLVAPTVCGKSILTGKIVKEMGLPALVLQPSKEILEQNVEKARAFGLNPTIYSASCGVKELSELTYATLKSIKKDVENLKRYGIRLILTDECFLGDVEILTENGFVRFDELKNDVMIAQYKNNHIQFVKPKRIIKREHNGEITYLKVRKGVEFPMTNGHEILYRCKKTGIFKKRKVEDMKFMYGVDIPACGISDFKDNEYLSPIERLYIAIQADGSIHNNNHDSTVISFSFSKQRKIERLFKLCKDANVDIWEVKGHKNKKNPNVKERRRFMVRMPKFATKNIWNHIKFPMSSKKAREVIDECVKWDGYVVSETMDYFSSTEKKQVDFYQAVAILAGYVARVTIEKDNRSEKFNDVHRLYIDKSRDFYDSQSFKKTKKYFNGLVYCVEVESGNIVVRYNGVVIVTGNCHAGYSPEPDSEFMKFITEFNDIKVLGLTATPCRLRSYGSLADGNYSKLNILTKDDTVYFQNIVHVTQIKELVDKKFWSPLVYERWAFDESDLVLNSTGAEYTQESIKLSIEKNGLNNTIYKRILRLMNERKHILVCMDSVESCNIISAFMNRKFGHITDVVSCETPKGKRSKIVEAFKKGELKIVFNYASLSTGFDFPELDCIVFGRPTFSYSVYYQALGRVVRIHKDKKDALVVDCCDNYRRFGRVEDMAIEKFPGYGWCMFAGDKLLTGVRLGVDVTKQMMQDRLNRIVNKQNSQELGNTIMWFGKYEGQRFQSIPAPYFDFLVNNMDFTNKPARFKKIIEWHNIVKLD